ncbi:MAG TPA: hypothetical protein PLT69_02625 [Deltaproteobacteria bacterium]|nr:hypothetical protein [Deltaproteobacteria bacterium]
MAIDPIRKVTVTVCRKNSLRLLREINRLGVMEVVDLAPDNAGGLLDRCHASTDEADEKIHQVDFILNLLDGHAPERVGLIEGLAPMPIVTTNEELSRILSSYDLQKTFLWAKDLDETCRTSERVIQEMETEIESLSALADLEFTPAEVLDLKRTTVIFGRLPREALSLLADGQGVWGLCAWEELPPEATMPLHAGRDMARVVLVALKEEAAEIQAALRGAGFEEIPLPRLKTTARERIDELRDTVEMYKEKTGDALERIQDFTKGRREGEGRRPLKILRAYWQNVRDRSLALQKGLVGRWVHVVSGYVRLRDIPRLTALVERDFPESMLVLEDPGPGDDVPVSLHEKKPSRPLSLLVEMFGLPPYRSFDPTPFLMFNFYVFFGICFSDVFYGVMLTAVSAFLRARTKASSGVNRFVEILFFGGISSIVFGALMGSWFGDLYRPEYLGEGNLLLRTRDALMVIDPMAKTVLALLVVLAIGVVNQFYGITLRMYGQLRRGDWLGAFSDGVCWIGALCGVLVVVAGVFADVPHDIARIGVWLLAVSSVCLVLTQGRGVENPLKRIAVGIVSLYGIVGSYGLTSFAGDVLSHCRLLALGLTTSIVAMAFNLMAGMLRDIPYVGALLFVAVLAVGHVFNFAISVLGAFVHSMRLVYVEFFGRFYEAGGRPFRPLGFDTPWCVLRKDAEEA